MFVASLPADTARGWGSAGVVNGPRDSWAGVTDVGGNTPSPARPRRRSAVPSNTVSLLANVAPDGFSPSRENARRDMKLRRSSNVKDGAAHWKGRYTVARRNTVIFGEILDRHTDTDTQTHTTHTDTQRQYASTRTAHTRIDTKRRTSWYGTTVRCSAGSCMSKRSR